MGTTCTICTHARRSEVETCLQQRVPYRRIATRFGLSRSAVSRHAAHSAAIECLPLHPVSPMEVEKIEPVTLPASPKQALAELQRVAEEKFNQANRRGDEHAALAWFKAAHGVVQDRVKLQGQGITPEASTVSATRETLDRQIARSNLLRKFAAHLATTAGEKQKLVAAASIAGS